MPSTPATNPKPPPTRIISWKQTVIEADANWLRGYLRPWIYEFSNGRQFLWDPSVESDPPT